MESGNALRPVEVLVVDDHGIVREGLAVLLERSARLRVVGTADNGKDAVAAALLLKPDVVVMDLVLPELSGTDATERIVGTLPDTRVVILSVCKTSEHVFRALRAGAQGYVLKQCAAAELVHAVLTVADGASYLSPQLRETLAGLAIDTAPLSPLERLSPREREVLQLTVGGATSVAIGRKLSLSSKTVDTYRSRIMEKLGVTHHAGLIRYAIEHAITPP
jgi:DNA-binding NarL/FixJ family response regulator